MAYNPSTFNYTPRQPAQFGGGQFGEFAQWLAQQGIDMFNLARADRNSQMAIANAFRQQQADRALDQQRWENAQQQDQTRRSWASQAPARIAAAQALQPPKLIPRYVYPGSMEDEWIDPRVNTAAVGNPPPASRRGRPGYDPFGGAFSFT